MRNIVYIVVISISFFFTLIAYPQQHWLKLENATTQNLVKCSFVDTSYGWAIGDSGTIVHTTNGGNNWITQNSKIREYMTDVFFINRRLGWALAWGLTQSYYGTYILKTTNGGTTWDTTTFPIPDTYIRTIYFNDSLTGYMGGGPAILLKTTNAGVNWFSCSVDTTTFISRFPISRFNFYFNNYGVALGGVMDIAGVFWKTTNAGLFWTAIAVAPEPITDIKIFDSLNFLAVGGDYEYGVSVLTTSNGGVNWNYRTMGVYGIPQNISFRTNTEGWCPMGYLPFFYMTSDAGSIWKQIDTPDSTKIFDIVFLNNKFGIGVGFSGAVVKFNPESVNISNNISTVKNFELFQNYPNPFNPNTNIEYNITEISEIELKVYNLLGQEITTIYKGIKEAGRYKNMFSGFNLPSGIYFYRLNAKNLKTGSMDIKTKKMVIIK
jgi:photosystem II stability/assembly factor-like uncharacterized protein